MKVTFLGTSAATAMPLPFCNCATCTEARRLKGKDFRKRSSVAINDDIIIDLGPDSVGACIEYGIDLTRIRYVLQTHAHSDHFDGGHLITRHPDYRSEDVNPISIVASSNTIRQMNLMLKAEDPSADLYDEDFLGKINVQMEAISHGECIRIGDYSITALESLHDIDQQSMIYLIEYKGKSVLYGTDLLEISDQAYRILSGRKLDILILDQTYGFGYNSGDHLDAGQVTGIIGRLRDKGIIDEDTHILATHISHEGNPNHEKMEEISRHNGYGIAFDGLVVSI